MLTVYSTCSGSITTLAKFVTVANVESGHHSRTYSAHAMKQKRLGIVTREGQGVGRGYCTTWLLMRNESATATNTAEYCLTIWACSHLTCNPNSDPDTDLPPRTSACELIPRKFHAPT